MSTPVDPQHTHGSAEHREGWWKRKSFAAKTGIVVVAVVVVAAIGGAFSEEEVDGQPTSQATEEPAQADNATHEESPEPEPESEASPEPEPEPEPDPEPEPEPEPTNDRFTVEHDPEDYDGELPGGTTTVRFEIRDNFTRGMIASGAERDTLDALEHALSEHPDTSRIVIEGVFPTMDDYGNETPDSVILRPFYDRETFERINFDNSALIDIWDLRDGGMIHRDLLNP